MENTKFTLPVMTPAQLQTELLRCEYCEEKPCKEACPAHCSPADFIMAARVGNTSDIRRSAAEIMHANPLGGICGVVCPAIIRHTDALPQTCRLPSFTITATV